MDGRSPREHTQPAKKLANVNVQIQAGLASSERVFNIIDVEVCFTRILDFTWMVSDCEELVRVTHWR